MFLLQCYVIYRFVVANSLYEASKAVNPNLYYNRRVLECKLAALVIEKRSGLSSDKAINAADITLKSVQVRSGKSPRDLLHELLKLFNDKVEPMSINELVSNGIDVDKIFKGHRLQSIIAEISRDEKTLELFKRAQHVFSEVYSCSLLCHVSFIIIFILITLSCCHPSQASRVDEFEAACASNETTDTMKMSKLGNLMRESHQSCAKDFDCSCDSLDKLVQVCGDAGAVVSLFHFCISVVV